MRAIFKLKGLCLVSTLITHCTQATSSARALSVQSPAVVSGGVIVGTQSGGVRRAESAGGESALGPPPAAAAVSTVPPSELLATTSEPSDDNGGLGAPISWAASFGVPCSGSSAGVPCSGSSAASQPRTGQMSSAVCSSLIHASPATLSAIALPVSSPPAPRRAGLLSEVFSTTGFAWAWPASVEAARLLQSEPDQSQAG